MAASGNPTQWFLGEYEFTVDGQRRLAIPKPWRQGGDGEMRFFLLPGREKSLQLVPGSVFQELLQKLRKVSFADAQAARAMASVGSMAQECVPDKQGRITLTVRLMDHAGIQDRALLLGAVTSIQIWNPETWHRQQMDSETGLDVLQELQEKPDNFEEILRKSSQE